MTTDPLTPEDAPVSVIVLTRDRIDKLRRCLELLTPQLGADDRVIIVDTGSSDGTPQEIEKLELAAVEVHEHSTGSWAEARNFGVGQATTPLIAFLDDDCYPAADWVERGRDMMRHSEAGGGYVELAEGLEPPENWSPEIGWLVGISIPGHLGPYAGSYYYPYTSNLWARRELLVAEPFQEVGGKFGDEDADRYLQGREDAEWWRRVRVRGHITAYDSDMRVAHDIDASRFSVEYLTERARRDGIAWARREGSLSDLPQIAYQIRSHRFPETAAGDTPESPLHHELMLARHKAAFDEVARLNATAETSQTSIQRKVQFSADVRFLMHRSKAAARRLIHAMSPPRPWEGPAESPRRIAIAAFGFLGDLVILKGFLRGLVRDQPELEIYLLTPPPGALIFGDLDGVHLQTLPKTPTLDPGIEDAKHFLGKWLTEAQPEVVVGPYLHGGWGTALVRIIHGIDKAAPLVGFVGDIELPRQRDVDRINLKVEKDLTLHESTNLERMFDRIKLPAQSITPTLEVPESGLAEFDAWQTKLPEELRSRLIITISPHAAKTRKEWPIERWAELVARLLKTTDDVFVINCARPEEEFDAAFNPLISAEPRVRVLRKCSLEVLIATLSRSRALLTVDSGPQHLAHAIELPSLTLYGPMDERRWGNPEHPDRHKTIRGGMFDLTHAELIGLPENYLMELIEIDAVEARAEALITRDEYQP